MIRKVLLVDDEPDIRTIGAMSLRRVGGWEVTVAASGPECIAEVARERPDLVLLDVMMPGMDGPATLAALRADPVSASVPVIFVTAKVQRSEIERWTALGALGVIRKPFDPLGLPKEIRALLGEGA